MPKKKKEPQARILSSKCSLRFSNRGKKDDLRRFIDEYHRVCQIVIDILWNMEMVPIMIPGEISKEVAPQTWLSARMIQACGKQASGIVRGTRDLQRRRMKALSHLISEGKMKQAKRLQRLIDETAVGHPDLSNTHPDLDSRFFTIDWENQTFFDGWITVSSIGEGMKLVLPFRRTKHLNDLMEEGSLKNGIRLSKNMVTFSFEMPEVPLREAGGTIGVDVGINSLFTCSTGQFAPEDPHGWTILKITERISRRKKDSKGFERACAHRESFINWSIKQMNLEGCSVLRMEDLRGLKSRPVSRGVRHWTYPALLAGVERTCFRHGVRVEHVDSMFTSQRCSSCGWTRRSNRRGRLFRCGNCGFATDADLNASLNLQIELPPRGADRRKGKNVEGFFWHSIPSGQEPMVPDVKTSKVESYESCNYFPVLSKEET
jgi:predicted RNA-binding Zn-ribbon protein involved in translation (DUF1610 family)